MHLSSPSGLRSQQTRRILAPASAPSPTRNVVFWRSESHKGLEPRCQSEPSRAAEPAMRGGVATPLFQTGFCALKLEGLSST